MILGMDITVTTPLEMGVGQQKYVVAYTLKQGVEKQPDILNAQNTKTDNVDSVQKMGSPAAIRPDALFSTSAKPSTYDHQQKSTPSSVHSTLKRNENNKNYMPINQMIGNNFNNQPPPYCATMMNDFDYETPLNYTVSYSNSAGTTTQLANKNFHKISPEYNNLNNILNVGASSGANDNQLLNNPEAYLEFERTTLDHRLGKEWPNGGPANNEHRFSGSEFASDPMDYKNLASQITTTISNINSTLNRSRNRNNITDIPGPESCV